MFPFCFALFKYLRKVFRFVFIFEKFQFYFSQNRPRFDKIADDIIWLLFEFTGAYIFILCFSIFFQWMVPCEKWSSIHAISTVIVSIDWLNSRKKPIANFDWPSSIGFEVYAMNCSSFFLLFIKFHYLFLAYQDLVNRGLAKLLLNLSKTSFVFDFLLKSILVLNSQHYDHIEYLRKCMRIATELTSEIVLYAV